MKTVEEHNAPFIAKARAEVAEAKAKPKPAGVKCECGAKMVQEDPATYIDSFGGDRGTHQFNMVKCPKCGGTNWKIVH